MLKTLLVIVAVASLSGCGGSSKSNDGDTGECMSIGQEKAGAKSKLKTLHYRNGGVEYTSFLYSEQIDIDNKSSTSTTRADAPGVNVAFKFKSEYYIKNHDQYITKVTQTDGKGNKLIVTYKPHGPSIPWDKVCKGKKWETTVNTYVNGKLVEKDKIEKRKIEDINVPKTVKSGTFNTYVMTAMSANNVVESKFWFDMETRQVVYKEDYDDSGKITRKVELVEYTY